MEKPFQIFMHPDYNSYTLENEIGLILLADPISFTSDNKVAPVCLPPADASHDEGIIATVTGWGALYTGKHTKDMSMNLYSEANVLEVLCSQINKNN